MDVGKVGINYVGQSDGKKHGTQPLHLHQAKKASVAYNSNNNACQLSSMISYTAHKETTFVSSNLFVYDDAYEHFMKSRGTHCPADVL